MELSQHLLTGDLPDSDDNPCKGCGLCCHRYRVTFYQGELDDNGGIVPAEMVEPVTPFFVCMKGTGTNANPRGCVALTSEGKCGIYENRPSPCREFKVWEEDGTPSERCQKLRKLHGIPPLKPFSAKTQD